MQFPSGNRDARHANPCGYENLSCARECITQWCSVLWLSSVKPFQLSIACWSLLLLLAAAQKPNKQPPRCCAEPQQATPAGLQPAEAMTRVAGSVEQQLISPDNLKTARDVTVKHLLGHL